MKNKFKNFGEEKSFSFHKIFSEKKTSSFRKIFAKKSALSFRKIFEKNLYGISQLLNLKTRFRIKSGMTKWGSGMTKLIFAAILFSLNFTNFARAANETEIYFAEKCLAGKCEFFENENGFLKISQNFQIGDKFEIDVVIKNPAKKAVNSVTAWIKYDSEKLRVEKINSETSPFELASPDGNKIDAKKGLVQIGRAAVGQSLFETEIYVVGIVFEVLSSENEMTTLQFHDFRANELGRVGVFSTSGLLTENILQTPPLPLSLFLNSQKPNLPVAQNLPIENLQNSNSQNLNIENYTTEILQNVARPKNLRIKTSNSAAEIIFDAWNENWIEGFFVYYSTTSGEYFFRKNIGKTNFTKIENLQNGQKYFFAVAAYDSAGRESDFSDEVFATIGIANSESAPFAANAFLAGSNFVGPNGTTLQTGPENFLFFAFCASIFATIFWRVLILKFLKIKK